MRDYKDIYWFHTINIGNDVVTQGVKSAEQLKAEFDVLGLTAEFLRGRRVLDIGCNDGYMSLQCARLGADVTAIDGIYRDSLKYVREHAETKFRFYCIDFLSPSFLELGRFDVILYLGVLYHTMYPFEQFLRLASASAARATVLIETEFYNLPGFEEAATVFYDYQQKLTQDWTSPVFPSVPWINRTLERVGFDEVTLLVGPDGRDRGRVTLRAKYSEKPHSPFLYAGDQV
jgi:tRNA (mo5U34)-methyltransferase